MARFAATTVLAAALCLLPGAVLAPRAPAAPMAAGPATPSADALIAAYLQALNTRDDALLRSLFLPSGVDSGCTALDAIVSNELAGHPLPAPPGFPSLPVMLVGLRLSRARVDVAPRAESLLNGHTILTVGVAWTYQPPGDATATTLRALVQWSLRATPAGYRIADQTTVIRTPRARRSGVTTRSRRRKDPAPAARNTSAPPGRADRIVSDTPCRTSRTPRGGRRVDPRYLPPSPSTSRGSAPRGADGCCVVHFPRRGNAEKCTIEHRGARRKARGRP